jgi:hypothetical protein
VYHPNYDVPFVPKVLYELWHKFPQAVPHLHWELILPCTHKIALAESDMLIADQSLCLWVSKCTLQELRDALDPFELVRKF